MKIEIFEITSKEDKAYMELLEQYKNNPELQTLLHESIIPIEMALAGDFRLITMLIRAIDMDGIKVYLLKDIDSNTFLWVIGEFVYDGGITMYPLLRKQSKKIQLEVRNVLIEKGLMKKTVTKLG
jgi:hypothetical protein